MNINQNITTIKKQDVVTDIYDANNNLTSLDENGYGYKLSLNDDQNSLSFIRQEGEEEITNNRTKKINKTTTNGCSRCFPRD